MTQTDKKLVESTINKFYERGKGRICEFCRLRGIKKRAYKPVEIDGIEWFLCWDCAGDEWEKKNKVRRKYE